VSVVRPGLQYMPCPTERRKRVPPASCFAPRRKVWHRNARYRRLVRSGASLAARSLRVLEFLGRNLVTLNNSKHLAGTVKVHRALDVLIEA
jgi:hypothetical protein